MRISGNTVLITGGATGIGYAIAEAFLKGNDVIVCEFFIVLIEKCQNGGSK